MTMGIYDRLRNILKSMNVYPKIMLKNMHLGDGIIFSQSVMLELINKGFNIAEDGMTFKLENNK